MEACTQTTGHAQFFHLHSKMRSKKYSMNSDGSRWTSVLFGCLIITSFSIPISISSSVQPLRWKFREWSLAHLQRYFERWLAISASLFRSGPPGLKNVIMIFDWNKIESSLRWQLPYYFLFVQVAIKLRIRNNLFGQECFVKFVLQIIKK